MAENLKTTRYADGSAIRFIESDTDWDVLSYVSKAYCWYEDSTTNRDIYGALYTWSAAMNGASSSDDNPSGVPGVCPDGWHLPSDSEWKELEMYLGMSQSEADDHGYRGTDQGRKMKEAGTKHWISPNDATNESGFTALPGGERTSGGSNNLHKYSSFWTSTDNETEYPGSAWNRNLFHKNSDVYRYYYGKDRGSSVRCVKD